MESEAEACLQQVRYLNSHQPLGFGLQQGAAEAAEELKLEEEEEEEVEGVAAPLLAGVELPLGEGHGVKGAGSQCLNPLDLSGDTDSAHQPLGWIHRS